MSLGSNNQSHNRRPLQRYRLGDNVSDTHAICSKDVLLMYTLFLKLPIVLRALPSRGVRPISGGLGCRGSIRGRDFVHRPVPATAEPKYGDSPRPLLEA